MAEQHSLRGEQVLDTLVPHKRESKGEVTFITGDCHHCTKPNIYVQAIKQVSNTVQHTGHQGFCQLLTRGRRVNQRVNKSLKESL